jgi:hypothetical protein
MDVRFFTLAVLGSALLFVAFARDARSQPPGRNPDVHSTITKIMKPSEEDKKNGILATITVKDSDVAVQITKGTRFQIARGKLVEEGTVDALVVGDRVSAWFEGKPTKTDPPQVKAGTLILFRAGKPDLPPRPR